MKLLATLLLCITTAFARLELASDTPTTVSTKLEEKSFLQRRARSKANLRSRNVRPG